MHDAYPILPVMLPAGTQLGRRERTLLLEASPEFVEPVPVLPHLPPQPMTVVEVESAMFTTRRAVKKLQRFGLIELHGPVVRRGPAAMEKLARTLIRTGHDHRRVAMALRDARTGDWKVHVRLRFMSRTPLGDEVVSAYRAELEAALVEGPLPRIRWR